MTKAEFLALGMALPDSLADCPFAEDFQSVVLRHRANRRWFALTVDSLTRPAVNLKCEPMKADFWRSVYRDVTPGWHMNKTHWNTVYLAGDVPDEVIAEMLRDSYDLTRPHSAPKPAQHQKRNSKPPAAKKGRAAKKKTAAV